MQEANKKPIPRFKVGQKVYFMKMHSPADKANVHADTITRVSEKYIYVSDGILIYTKTSNILFADKYEAEVCVKRFNLKRGLAKLLTGNSNTHIKLDDIDKLEAIMKILKQDK